MKRRRSCGCFSLPVLLMLGFLIIVYVTNSNDRTEDTISDLIVSTESPNQPAVILPTQAAPTFTPKPEATITPPLSASIYSNLVAELDGEIIHSAQLVDQSLVIHTNLTRSDLVTFYEEIGTIHGVVVRENPNIDSVILSDVTGQQIIMQYHEMMSFYEGSINWDQFRDTWEIINP